LRMSTPNTSLFYSKLWKELLKVDCEMRTIHLLATISSRAGSEALVAYPSSPEPITSVPYVSVGFSRMNNSYTMPQGSGYSYGTMPNNGHLQQIPYTQPNHIPHVPNSSNTNV